jgi:hypothetical protein
MNFALIGSVAVALEDLPLPPVVAKIESYRHLRAGWSFGVGEPFKGAVIDQAIKLANSGLEMGLTAADAFPGPEGEVRVTFYYGGKAHYFECTICAPNQIDFVYESNGVVEVEKDGLTLEVAKEVLLETWTSLWSTFASLTHSTTTLSWGAFKTSLSSLQQPIVKYQSSKWTALNEYLAQFADT